MVLPGSYRYIYCQLVTADPLVGWMPVHNPYHYCNNRPFYLRPAPYSITFNCTCYYMDPWIITYSWVCPTFPGQNTQYTRSKSVNNELPSVHITYFIFRDLFSNILPFYCNNTTRLWSYHSLKGILLTFSTTSRTYHKDTEPLYHAFINI